MFHDEFFNFFLWKMKEASGRWKTSEVPRSDLGDESEGRAERRITAGLMEKKRWLLRC